MSDLKMHTANLVAKNIEKLTALFPNCITETCNEQGEIIKGVDFDLLRQELSDVLVEGEQERYTLNWVGKKESILAANAPIAKTLRPCREESVNFDTTENLFIEGDNLDALKLLQENYLGKVKMIYIDPPYNTGEDFIYEDNFSECIDEFLIRSNQVDDEGNRLVANTESNGRFHSNWLSMMYSRLKIAHNLLDDERGVIFISINDVEINTLKQMCNELFNENNFIAQLIWQNKKGGGNDSSHIAIEHEYVLLYAKNKELLHDFFETYSEEYEKRYKEQDEVSRFYWDTFKRKSGKQYYPIECPDGTILEYDEDGNPISWLRSESRFLADKKIGEIRFVRSNENKWSVQFKQRMPQGKKPRSIIKNTIIDEYGTTSSGSKDIYEYFKKDVFSNPKPLDLLKFFIGFGANEDNDIVLDFFAGSGTTAEAVLACNKKDEINRRYILVQYQENIDNMLKSSNANARLVARNAISVLDELSLPHFITELTKERIRRAGSQILQNLDEDKPLDVGFRVLKIDSSNMKDIYYQPEQYDKTMLDQMVSHIKEDRSAEDLLFQVMLDWGIELSLPIELKTIDGSEVYFVAGNTLVACFDKFTMNVVDEIAKVKPLRVVSTELAIMHDQDKTNIKERFKQLSPDTEVKFL